MSERVRVDWECLTTTAVASMATASMPMHRAVPRATFGSRLSLRRGAAASSAHGKSQAPFETKRPRGHPKALRRAIPPYEGRALPLWQPQTPNWCHGLTDGKHPVGSIGGWRLQRCSGRGWPNREFCPLMATFLMLARSRGAIGRVRATPGALPTAGRRSDGPDGRVDGIPGKGKGLSGEIPSKKRPRPRAPTRNKTALDR